VPARRRRCHVQHALSDALVCEQAIVGVIDSGSRARCCMMTCLFLVARAELDLYLRTVCDDMQGWHKQPVVDWCRRTIPHPKNLGLIRGLLAMYPGNLVESVCSMGLRLCKSDPSPGTPNDTAPLSCAKATHPPQSHTPYRVGSREVCVFSKPKAHVETHEITTICAGAGRATPWCWSGQQRAVCPRWALTAASSSEARSVTTSCSSSRRLMALAPRGTSRRKWCGRRCHLTRRRHRHSRSRGGDNDGDNAGVDSVRNTGMARSRRRCACVTAATVCNTRAHMAPNCRDYTCVWSLNRRDCAPWTPHHRMVMKLLRHTHVHESSKSVPLYPGTGAYG
jgi:hypothetical protein